MVVRAVMIGPPSKKMPHYAGVPETMGVGGGQGGPGGPVRACRRGTFYLINLLTQHNMRV